MDIQCWRWAYPCHHRHSLHILVGTVGGGPRQSLEQECISVIKSTKRSSPHFNSLNHNFMDSQNFYLSLALWAVGWVALPPTFLLSYLHPLSIKYVKNSWIAVFLTAIPVSASVAMRSVANSLTQTMSVNMHLQQRLR